MTWQAGGSPGKFLSMDGGYDILLFVRDYLSQEAKIMKKMRKISMMVTALLLTAAILCGCRSETKETPETETPEEPETIEDYTELTDAQLEVLAYDDDVNAQLELAGRYDYGTAENGQDFELAAAWYEKAAEAGNGQALTVLGYRRLHGISQDVDLSEAVSFFRRGLEAGNEDAAIGIARAYMAGYDGFSELTQEELTAIADLKLQKAQAVAPPSSEAAATDDLDAKTVAYYYVSRTYEKETPLSQYAMAYCLETGTGAVQDSARALELYQQVADKKELSVYDAYLPNAANTRIGIMYTRGEGLAQDYRQAQEAFLKAADNGYAMAQFYMGVLYENGLGMERDYETAFSWYEKAAEQNYAPALNQIGYLYYNGNGVEADVKQAIYYHKLAAMQGYGPAQINLGYLYENGIGVEQNLSMALAYYQLAAEQDYEGTKEAIQRVSRLMNEEGQP